MVATFKFTMDLPKEPERPKGELTIETLAILAKAPLYAKGAAIRRTQPMQWMSICYEDRDTRETVLCLEYWYGQNPHMNIGTHVGIDDNGAQVGIFTLEDLQQAWTLYPRPTDGGKEDGK